MPPQDVSKRRRRGIVLTPSGLQKLLEAKAAAEFAENQGNRYTLEALSERTGLAVDTLTKVLACESKVDKQTLKTFYRSFNLDLQDSDFYYPEDSDSRPTVAIPTEVSPTVPEPELPEGQVPLNSRFYVERPPVEADSFKAVLQPGSLIRIKGARRTGKTSLMKRILHYASQHQYQTVSLNFQLADRAIFEDLTRFLQWVCASVGLGLGLPNHLDDFWDDLFGNKISCKMYFEQYLLPTTPQPVVLGLDNVDHLFEHPELASDFFSLLRSWHEEGKNRDIWKKLRLVVVHSTEVYIPLEANKSPFNVGLPIELPTFTSNQIQTLAHRYNLDWTAAKSQQLMALVGGQPYLIKKALYHLWRQDVSFEELLTTATSPDGIYGDHLQWQQLHLQRRPQLAEALQSVLKGDLQDSLDLVSSSYLQSLGLITLHENMPTLSCRLYAEFFGTS
jgi:hypothetical protein